MASTTANTTTTTAIGRKRRSDSGRFGAGAESGTTTRWPSFMRQPRGTAGNIDAASWARQVRSTEDHAMYIYIHQPATRGRVSPAFDACHRFDAVAASRLPRTAAPQRTLTSRSAVPYKPRTCAAGQVASRLDLGAKSVGANWTPAAADNAAPPGDSS